MNLHFHQETKIKLLQVTQKLSEAREEGLQIRADCQAMIKQYQVRSLGTFLSCMKLLLLMLFSN